MPPFSPATLRRKNSSGTRASKSMMGEPTPISSKVGMKKFKHVESSESRNREAHHVGALHGELRRNSQVRDEQGFVIDFDQQRVIARFGKGEIPDFIYQINSMQRTLRLERSFEQWLGGGRIE